MRISNINTMKTQPISASSGIFSVLPDPRKTNHSQIRHELLNIIVIAILAVICGADTWMEIAELESKRVMAERISVASHAFHRMIRSGGVQSAGSEAFEGCFFAWVKTVQKRTKGEVIAIDGKSARRAHARESKPLHLVMHLQQPMALFWAAQS